jgi:Flp pilus assembly protein TadB
MPQGVVLALLAGVATAATAWLILAAGAREHGRLQRAMGIAAGTAPGPRSTVDVLARLARLAPAPVFEPLGGRLRSSYVLTPLEHARWSQRTRGLGALFAVALAVLGILANPVWLFGLFLVPLVARGVMQTRLRAFERRRRRELDRDVTAALDVFVLALEAGLPFERALTAYADTADTALSTELRTTVRELEVGYRRREALERVVSRTGSASLAAVASAARLAEDFGTPLAAALRTLAVELRAQRRQRLQEAALRAPVTMLLPTAGFILVPIFGIVLGPIAIRLATGTLF